MGFQHLDQTGDKNSAYRHGMSNTPTWRSWSSMLQRVDGKDSHSYLYVGVTVCKRWRKFENFYKDMGERPEGTSLDRIIGPKGYRPGNCRWATAKEQRANTEPRVLGLRYSNSRLIEHNNQWGTVAEWSRELDISVQTLRYRIKHGLSLSQPKRRYRRKK